LLSIWIPASAGMTIIFSLEKEDLEEFLIEEAGSDYDFS